MIYEFLGLPGAGKSYISSKLANQKKLECIHIAGKKERVLRALLFIMTHPVFSMYMMYLFTKENYKNISLFKHKLLTIVIEIMAREQKAGNKNCIVETGFFQLMLSLFERKIEHKDIALLFRWLHKRSYTVYIVEADTAVREKRIQERGRIPRGGIVTDTDKLSAWFTLLEYNFEIIKASIQKNNTYEIIQNN